MWRSKSFGQEPRGFSWLRLEFRCPVTFQRQCDFFLSYKFTWLVPLLWALVVYSWATKKRVSGDNSILISRFYDTPTWGRSANKPEPALLGSTRTVGRAEHRCYVRVCIVNKHPKNWETALWGKERLYWKKGFINRQRLHWKKDFIEEEKR